MPVLDLSMLSPEPVTPRKPVPMRPSRLRGGFALKGKPGLDDFLDAFVSSITGDEWLILSQIPPIKRVTELVDVVCKLRLLTVPEINPAHPLAAAVPDGE